MRRTAVRSEGEEGLLAALVVVGACFLGGALAGCLAAGWISEEGQAGLTRYLEQFLQAAAAGQTQAPALLLQVWDILRWPLLALLLGFTGLGLLGLPLLFVARGFLLSFSIAAVTGLMGGSGCILGFLLFGISGAISLPVFFVLGVQSLLSARALAGRAPGTGVGWLPGGRRYLRRWGLCAVALGVCLLLEQGLVPKLVGAAAGALLSGGP